MPTRERTDITHTGSAIILKDLEVKNVLFVLDFKFNFLFVSKLTKELCCSVHFYPDFCVFQDLWSGRVRRIGKEKGGLYVAKDAHIAKVLQQISAATTQKPEFDGHLWQ